MTVRTHRVGRQGLTTSVEGLGTMGMTAMYGTPNDIESEATIRRAVDLGVTLFDTADMYGPFTGEELVGRALAPYRDRVVVATKFGGVTLDETGKIVGGPNGRPDYVRQAVEGSLRRLGTDHIDLYYQHRVDPGVPVTETFGALGELVTEGKVRYLGISEASAENIRAAHATAPLSAVQTEYSLFTRTVETNGVLDTVRELGIGFVAYSPLGRGFLTGELRTLDELPENDWRRSAPRFSGDNFAVNLALADRVRVIADEYGATPGQLALAWVLAQGITAIPGTKRRPYLEENVGAVELTLDEATLTALDEAIPVDQVEGERYVAAAMKAIQG
ncbi:MULTISPECIES: aldo/keto reductase [unclassified Amycolatopsis]|uniref:aldo/keto reductase n=1 Tax=unclassified Amycolatopsis TaxID=2618356 RepID=UPI001C69C2E3|nr:aldo/keto reductase [Amycolatopsis sp. DSM 110486]QYN26567.1 aldo/keto reductase [Amycolatopsis sp. DSM 110486]